MMKVFEHRFMSCLLLAMVFSCLVVHAAGNWEQRVEEGIALVRLSGSIACKLRTDLFKAQ